MNICVFDTETITASNPFCYNLGYTIVNVESRKIVKRVDLLIDEVFCNEMLFELAFFKEKKDLYIQRANSGKIRRTSFEYALKYVEDDFNSYKIKYAFAYNCTFDKRVISYNCKWFKEPNIFEKVTILDIWGLASEFVTSTEKYQQWAEAHNRFTENGNISASAENVWQFLNNSDKVEEHTALADSEMETNILLKILEANSNIDLFEPRKPIKIIAPSHLHQLQVMINKEYVMTFNYSSKIEKDGKIYFTFPEGKVPPFFYQNGGNENF